MNKNTIINILLMVVFLIGETIWFLFLSDIIGHFISIDVIVLILRVIVWGGAICIYGLTIGIISDLYKIGKL